MVVGLQQNVSDQRPLTQVAVGVVHRIDGQVLFTQRPAGKPYAGWWEFPGGKLEANERLEDALKRELQEELGITITDCHHFYNQTFSYPHAKVRLQFCHVRSFIGTVSGLENQAIQWGNLLHPPLPFLPAALPLLKALRLPQILRLTAVMQLGFDHWSAKLQGLNRGCVIVHEPQIDENQAMRVLQTSLQWRDALPEHRQVLVSSRHPKAWWAWADGVHFTERDLLALNHKPSFQWLGASVHSKSSIDHAAHLGFDFAVAGTVLASASHPQGVTLGWAGLGERLESAPICTYALGGLAEHHLAFAFAAGAYGIAAKRSVW